MKREFLGAGANSIFDEGPGAEKSMVKGVLAVFAARVVGASGAASQLRPQKTTVDKPFLATLRSFQCCAPAHALFDPLSK